MLRVNKNVTFRPKIFEPFWGVKFYGGLVLLNKAGGFSQYCEAFGVSKNC